MFASSVNGSLETRGDIRDLGVIHGRRMDDM